MNDIERKLRDLGERTSEAVRHGEVPRGRIVRRARRRRAMVVGVPTVVAVVLAAVVLPRLDLPGRDGTDEGRVVELAAVASATEEAGTARLELEMALDMGDDPTTMRGIGVVDFENVRSRMFLEQTAFTPRVEMVSIGSTVFTRVLDEDGVGEPQWTKTDVPNGAAASPALGDPSDFLSYLEGTHDVTDLGDETLDGDPVTHYRAEMEAPSAVPEGLEFDLEPMHVWVDEEGRLRRLTFGATSDDAGSMHMEMRLWDFGVPVEIEAPDPEDVSDEPFPGSSFRQNVTPEAPDGELNEFGVDEVYTLTGEEGSSGPHVLVTIAGDSVGVCISMAPPGTSRAMLFEAGSDEAIVAVSVDRTESNPYKRGGCMGSGLPADLADRMRTDPEQFELRFEREDAPDVVVPLTNAF